MRGWGVGALLLLAIGRAAPVAAAPEGELLLHRIQRATHERVMFVPIAEPAFLNGVGPRVEEAGLGPIAGHRYSAPYEDLRIKAGRR